MSTGGATFVFSADKKLPQSPQSRSGRNSTRWLPVFWKNHPSGAIRIFSNGTKRPTDKKTLQD
jgi:hypothetical protein